MGFRVRVLPWQGTATYSEVGSDESPTDTVANLVWARIDGAQDPPAITYLPTGDVTVTMGGTCSGGGTMPLSGLTSSLTTYDFVPADAPARNSYKGQGYESATVGITCQGQPGQTFVGPWFTVLPPSPPALPFFTVSPDGKHMTGTSSPTPGLTWQWDLHAVQQP
ncbi:MAG: hypothetical protein PHQ91_11500 [Thermoanaerobaculaceae bacterium]|nr:hypothetical protein [Thermoanaerobaculaceae bacterium]TAM56098.1 MAG: hypothetical protein EPN53_02275 [Acidobacteriota bacterium]